MKNPGIWVGDVHSVRDFGMCYENREADAPPKRVVKMSIPYRNGAVDFSAWQGEPFYDERTITYTFEAIDDNPQGLQKQVDDFVAWLVDLTDTDIHDDEMPAWHWRGSCDEVEIDYEDGTGTKATVTATFNVYPFKIADDYSCAFLTVGDNEIYNEGRKARITVIPKGTVTIQVGPVRQTFYGETVSDLNVPHGYSTIKVTGGSAEIRWNEEVV